MSRARRTRRLPGPAAALLLATLAGCAGAREDGAASVLNEVLEAHRADIAGIGGARPPAAGAPAAQAPRRVASAPGGLSALLGQGAEGVVRTLGQPSLRRREGTAEIWLYTGEDCALDLVFYGARLAWAAPRATGPRRQTEAACLSALARRAPSA